MARPLVKDSFVSLAVSAEVRADVQALAVALDRPMSWVMLQGIREYLARELPKHKPRKA